MKRTLVPSRVQRQNSRYLMISTLTVARVISHYSCLVWVYDDMVLPLATKSLMLEFCFSHSGSIRMLFPGGNSITIQSTSVCQERGSERGETEMDRWCIQPFVHIQSSSEESCRSAARGPILDHTGHPASSQNSGSVMVTSFSTGLSSESEDTVAELKAFPLTKCEHVPVHWTNDLCALPGFLIIWYLNSSCI